MEVDPRETEFLRKLTEFTASELGSDLSPDFEQEQDPLQPTSRSKGQKSRGKNSHDEKLLREKSQPEKSQPEKSQPEKSQPEKSQPEKRTPSYYTPPVRDRTCPKCGTKNPRSLIECRSCGIVFSRYKPAPNQNMLDGLQLARRRDLIALWESVMNDYANERKHEEFVAACRRADSLAFAAFTYSRILEISPDEEIAAMMRERVKGFASFGAEAGDDLRPWNFRVPRLNLLAILFSSIVFFFGVLLVLTNSTTGTFAGSIGLGRLWLVGLLMLGLTLGLNFVLRPPRN